MTLAVLKKRTEFVRVARGRNTVRRDNIWVQCFYDEKRNSGDCRVGFTASKKVGKAVYRNRSKRRMRSLVRLMLPEILKTFPDFKGDIVLIAVPTTVDCDYTILTQNFKSAICRCIGRLNVELNGDNNSSDFKRGV